MTTDGGPGNGKPLPTLHLLSGRERLLCHRDHHRHSPAPMTAKRASDRRRKPTIRGKRKSRLASIRVSYKSRGYSGPGAISDSIYPENDLPCSLYERAYET